MTVPSFSWTLSVLPGPVDFGTGSVTSASAKAAPQVRDLALDVETHDLVLTAGDLQLTAGLPSIRQDAENRMRFMRGEWFLDLLAGIPYFQSVLVKSPNIETIRSIFRDEIAGTKGLVSVDKLKLNYSPGTRKLRVDWEARSDTNELIAGTDELGVG